MSQDQNRVRKGVSTGGQYAPTAHGEPSISLELEPGTPEYEQRIKSVVEGIRDGDEKFTLTYVHYDDTLPNEQVGNYLAGDLDSVNEHLNETYDESAWMSARETAREKLKEAGIDPDDVEEEDLEEIVQHIQDKDDSDPLPQLLRNGGDKLMRIKLATPEPGYQSGHAEGAEELREQKIAQLLNEKGLDTSTQEAKDAISELVANGPWDWHEGVDLEVIYYDAPSNSTLYDDTDGEIRDRELSFTDPHILLIDRWNGSGHDVSIPGTVKAVATKDEPVRLDAATGHGYSWDDVAGVVHSAYRNEPESAFRQTTAPQENQ